LKGRFYTKFQALDAPTT